MGVTIITRNLMMSRILMRFTPCVIQVGVVALGAPKRLQYLILDERQQGADHQGHAFASQGWQLITQGLASSAGQQAEHVSALHDGVDDLTLQRPALVAVASTLQQHDRLLAVACASMP